MISFQWDELKNRLNLRKHGVGFELAQKIFANPTLEKQDDRQVYDEDRYLALGEWETAVYVIAFTIRDDAYRIISIRRAKDHEWKTYYQWRFKKDTRF